MKKLSTIIPRLALIFLAISVASCQSPKDKGAGWTSSSGQVRPGPTTGKAVLALLSKARQSSTKGSLSTAESYLERALRIEPQNPTLWLYMAKLRFYAEKPAETVNLAKKALALSYRGGKGSKDSRDSLQADCWQLIAHSYQKLGDWPKALKAQNKAKSLRN